MDRSFSWPFCHPSVVSVGCTPDVCNHHGTCVPNISNGFTCQCDPGFTGTTCNEGKGRRRQVIHHPAPHLELDECLSSPCANNGTCTDLENGFLCHCLPEWNGTLCTEAKGTSARTSPEVWTDDALDPCRSSPCGPFGKCITTNQPQIPYYCQCPDGQNTVFRCAEPSESGFVCSSKYIDRSILKIPVYPIHVARENVKWLPTIWRIISVDVTMAPYKWPIARHHRVNVASSSHGVSDHSVR